MTDEYYIKELDLDSFLEIENSQVKDIHRPYNYDAFISDLERKPFKEIKSDYFSGDYVFRLKSLIKSLQYK